MTRLFCPTCGHKLTVRLDGDKVWRDCPRCGLSDTPEILPPPKPSPSCELLTKDLSDIIISQIAATLGHPPMTGRDVELGKKWLAMRPARVRRHTLR